ncbi:transglycosylase [Roseburia inulinivorans]|uniref:Transglycosylase n=1 Tax=Roseburia inulinivorans TaxID=360807 RepID=A0A3R6J6N6_9FIRM|nr:transglycosylase [Roseburia inulinivorans]RHF00412.1 transglycosylase [Roseburia inulinivorans]
MKKNHLSTETLAFEIISAIAALFYMGLQVYYGIVYGAGAVRIVMNVLILILVYMGLTVLAVYPERVNGLSREVCTGAIRKYTIRMVELIKLVFVLSLLFTSICDALGYRVDAAYSLIVMGLILVVAVVFEVKIIKILRKLK